MTEPIGTTLRPARIAIVGAGPAGFYAAETLLKKEEVYCTIDLFNRFPTPFGLVREGVAPDHQSIKSVARVFDKIAENERLRFYGNVTFGVDVTHDDLSQFYDIIIYAVGAQADRRMGIPGEDLRGSLPANQFVGWYNGHPDYGDLDVDFSHERAVVIGNGNVALDVARILVSPVEELAKTDIADYALDRLKDSRVREVVILGRRGPEQAAFTNHELRELGEVENIDVIVDPEDLLPHVGTGQLPQNKMAAQNIAVLKSYAARDEHKGERRVRLRFAVSPVEILGDGGRVKALRIEKNELVRDAYGGVRARGTGEFETLEVGLVLRSVGYRSMPLPGVPFDEETMKIPNIAGRVIYTGSEETVEGEYVVGWAKRGPVGVIGTNKPDAVSTVNSILEDLPSLTGIADQDRELSRIEDLLKERGVDFVTYEDWKRLDAFETARGTERGRPRVKLTEVAEMMRVIRAG